MTKTLKALPLLLFLIAAFGVHPVAAQTPDCSFTFTATGDSTQTGVSNLSGGTPCANWRITYSVTGTLATTVTFQTSPDNSTFTSVPNTVCSSSVQPPCIFQGTNPLTGTTQGMSLFAAYGSYVRVTTSSSSGTGTVTVRGYGAKGTSASANQGTGSGGGGITQAYQTIDSNGTAQTQRSTVNFISGTGATVTCVDNAGSTRTDCTVTSTATGTPTFPVNAQTSTYQLLAADFTSFKTIAVASGTFTITGVASGSQPATGTGVWIVNYGTGVLTFARSGQNINGAAANLTIPAGSSTAPQGLFVVSDGTNYIAQPFGSTGYNTIDSNGSAVTQRQTVNFISGTNATVTCVDNAGSTRTDCTVAATAGAAAPVFPVNAQTSTYQLLAGDFTNFKTIAVASGTFTITAVASGSQPAGGTGVWIINYGTGVITFARSGQNINGAAANLTIAAGSASAPQGLFVVSDGTNYIAQPLIGSSGGGGGSTITSVAIGSLPGTCTQGNLYLLTDTVYSQALCGASNTFTYYGPFGQMFPPPSAGWTLDNGGTASLTTTKGFQFLNATKLGAVNLVMAFRTQPSTPYTITALLATQLNDVNNSPTGRDIGFALGFRESATSKLSMTMVYVDGQFAIETDKWNSSTSYNAFYSKFTFPSTVLSFVRNPFFLRIANDAVNLTFSMSVDGVNFQQINQVAVNNFFTTAPDQVGFAVYPNGNNVETSLISWQVQ